MANKIDIEDIKKEFIDLFNENSLQNGIPDYYKNIKQEGIKNFELHGIPGKKNEDYKYLNIQDLFNTKYQKSFKKKNGNIDLEEIFKCDVPDLDTKVLLLLNGFYYDKEEELTITEDGVIMGSLLAASKKYPEIVSKHIGKYAKLDKNGLIGLNSAFATDGIFVYVPKNTVLKKPIQVVNLLLDEIDIMTQHRSLIVVEENAQASVVICDHTLSPNRYLTNSVLEVFVNKNGILDLSRLQNEHNGSVQLTHTFVHQEKDSKTNTNIFSLHGGIIRNNVYVTMNDEGCESNTYGLYLSDRTQHIDNFVFVDHAKPNCLSNQLFKGVLDDMATGAFNGKILVQKDAQHTQAFQANNNIILTDDADINTKPQLEIYADDVKCSHGATVGQLDTEALFYMQSRGIGEKEARMLLMNAFVGEVIDHIAIEALKERIQAMVEKRLNGELSRCNNCVMHCCN